MCNQSVARYARQQEAAGEIKDSGAEGGAAQPPAVPSPGASAYSRIASKAVSSAFNAFSKVQMPGPRQFAGMEDRVDTQDTGPDLERERRLLEGRAALAGLGGRFGARSRCQFHAADALRPSPGLLELQREQTSGKGLLPGRGAPGILRVT